MKISLTEEACNKNGSNLDQILQLLIITFNCNLEEAKKKLIEEGYISADHNPDSNTGWWVTNKGNELLSSIIVDSESTKEQDERLVNLASRLKEIFPTGKKDGTNYYWADGVAIIVKRLKLFFRKYESKYTDEQIIDAATRYVESFNGNYTYMKLLKYFIFKDGKGASGEVECDSQLVSYIENSDQEDTSSNNWETTLK